MNRKAQGFALIDLIFVCGIIGLLVQHRAAAAAARQAGGRRGVGDRFDARHQQRAADVRVDVRLRLLRAEPDDARHARRPAATSRSSAAGLGTPTRSSRAATSFRWPRRRSPGAPGLQRPRRRARRARASGPRRIPRYRSNPRFFATNANSRSTRTRRSLFAAMPEVGEPRVGPSAPLIQL